MLSCYVQSTKQKAIPIIILKENEFSKWLKKQDKRTKAWLENNAFKAKPGSHCLLPANDGGSIDKVLLSVNNQQDIWSYADLATRLPESIYQFDNELDDHTLDLASIAWGLDCYRFSRYKKSNNTIAKLLLKKSTNKKRIDTITGSIYLVRDLINTPTEDLGPEQLNETAKKLAKKFDARCKQIVGAQLLKQNYPAIHVVGRASSQSPRLIDLTWGNPRHPRVTLVGKGVCFDSGGLDIKPSHGMRLMKKDMGGAAHVLGLAQMIMTEKLKLRLRVLIPAVENAVSGNAYRPGDVIKSRKGLTIEIGNTDAEGRVILADALALASEEKPKLLIDFATLTGAARVAVGTDIAALFSNNDNVANDLLKYAEQQQDPLWRLPLHTDYRKLIDSPIADISNTGSTPYGGAITAALFLQEFIEKNIPWVHFDIMAWNTNSRPGRPEGGEAMAIRAVFAYLQSRFSR